MADSIQPNPFTIDPAGNVQVVGLDLPAGTSQTPPAQSRVRWIRQSDGAVLAEQLGTEYGVPTPQAQLQQLVYALSGDSSASLEMSAQQPGSPDWFTQLLLLCNPAGQVAKVNAQANDGAGNTNVVTIIDSGGDSSFVQAGAGVSKLKVFFLNGLPYNIGAGVTATGQLAAVLPATYVIFGYCNGQPCPWSVQSYTNNVLTIELINPYGAAVTGTLYLAALTSG